MKFNSISAMKAAVLATVAFVGLQSAAMPALPRPVSVDDGKGGRVEVLIHGDEHFHVLTTIDATTVLSRDASGALKAAGPFNAEIFRARARAAARAPQMRLSSGNAFPCFGTQRAVAILVEFPETRQHPQGRKFGSEDPRQLFSDLLNSESYTHDGATGSVRTYFKDNSNGIFEPVFDVFGPVMLSEDVNFYNDQNSSDYTSWRMVEEACRGIDEYVDFSEYDRDHDGVIDNVYIFYAGPGAATGGDPSDCIWQHAGDVELLSVKQFVFDGVRLNHYACSNEYRDVDDPATGQTVRQTEGIGTVCHEFSHVLGLPDLYDVNYYGNNSPGLWDVMDTGCHLNESRTPAAFSALDRMLLGWLEPETIGDAPRTLTLPSIASNKAYTIPTANDENEFFLLENRQQTGWDSALPGHGMLVWRINYQKDYWDANQVNTGRSRSHAIILCADGYRNQTDLDGDPFPGAAKVTGITDDTYPSMLSSDGVRTNAPLSSITEAAGIITFDVCRAVTFLDKVAGLRAVEVTPTSFVAQWDAIPMSPGYAVSVFGVDGSPVGVYDNLAVTGTSVEVTGLTPETQYTFTVYGIAGAVKGAESDPCTVTTPAMSFAFTMPEVLEAEQIESNSFRAAWLPLDDAVDYALTVMTAVPGDDRYVAVDFTGGIESLPSGWSTNCISTMSMKGYYGHEAPALSMGADYARLQSPLLSGDLLAVEFWYRERTPSGHSSLGVEVLAGAEWIEIESIALSETMTEGIRYAIDQDLIPEGARALRLIYHRDEKGTLAIDDVKITYCGETHTTALDNWNDRRLGSSDTSVMVDGLESLTEYFYSVRGIDAQGVMSTRSHTAKVTTKETLSVSDITVDTETHELYDLYGRKVCEGTPAPGIYILKTNNAVKKLIYK